jgi:hypothetical protein
LEDPLRCGCTFNFGSASIITTSGARAQFAIAPYPGLSVIPGTRHAAVEARWIDSAGRIVEHVGVTVPRLRVEGRLHHRISSKESTDQRIVHTSLHVHQTELRELVPRKTDFCRPARSRQSRLSKGCMFRAIAIARFGGWRSVISEHRDRSFRPSRSPISRMPITSLAPPGRGAGS